MKERSVVSVLLLTIFTCGIYGIYWTYVMTEDLNEREPEDPLMNYILSILLSIITCGIYGIYWLYKFYKKIDSVTGEDNFVLNFILSLIGLNLVSTCIVQNSVNNM